jgi:hypothetical protein
MLAFEAPLVCALTSFAAALLYFYAWRIGTRPWWVLLAVAGWLNWTIYFAMLAISAGPAPMISRSDITAMVRWSELLGGILLMLWLVFWTRRGIRSPFWYVPDDKASYTRETPC